MPRIRTIKPEFWQDEKMAAAPLIDRFVFLGLISMADDAGRLLDNLKVIDAFIFPRSEESAGNSLVRLTVSSRIRRGVTDSGQPIIEIVNWARHQRIDRANLKAALPKIAHGIRLDGSSPTPPRYIDEASTTSPRNIPTTNDLRSTTSDLVVQRDLQALDAGDERRPDRTRSAPKNQPASIGPLVKTALDRIQAESQHAETQAQAWEDQRVTQGAAP